MDLRMRGLSSFDAIAAIRWESHIHVARLLQKLALEDRTQLIRQTTASRE